MAISGDIYILTAGFKFLRKNMEYNDKGRAEPLRKTKAYSLNKAQFCWPVFEDSLDKRRDWLCDL